MCVDTDRNGYVIYKHMDISRGRNRLFVYKYAHIQRGAWVIYIHIREYQGRIDGQIISIETRAREDSILSAEYAIFYSLQ